MNIIYIIGKLFPRGRFNGSRRVQRPTMCPPNSSHTDHAITDCFKILAHPERRTLLQQLQTSPTTSIPVAELATHLSHQHAIDQERGRISLEQIHLPRLAAADVITHDSEAQTVQYHPDPLVEALLDCVSSTVNQGER